MKTLLMLLTVFTMGQCLAQDKTAALAAQANLVGGSWIGEGTWSDGSPYKPEFRFTWGLAGNMIKSETYGESGPGQGGNALRNEGFRVWDESTSSLRFWEFDIFGGITEGTIETAGKDFLFHYVYDFGQGPMQLTDAWLYKSDDLYEFIVGVYQDGSWQQKFIELELKRSS